MEEAWKNGISPGDWFTVESEPDSIWIAVRFEPRYAQFGSRRGEQVGWWVIAGGLKPERRTYDCFAPADCVPALPEAAAKAAARVEAENARTREWYKEHPYFPVRPEFPNRDQRYTSQHPLQLPLKELDMLQLLELEAHMRMLSGDKGEQFTMDDFWDYMKDNDLAEYLADETQGEWLLALYSERWKYDDQRRTLYHFASVAHLEPDGSLAFLR